MRVEFYLSVALLAVPGTLHAQDYLCSVGTPYVVQERENAVKGLAIEFGELDPDDWSFEMSISDDEAVIAWPRSPIQLEGSSAPLPTGPTSSAYLFFSEGPCLFTESACMTMVHSSQQPTGELEIQIQPTALTRDETGARHPFNVQMAGTCVPKDSQ